MSKKKSYLLGVFLTIIFGTLLYCYLCDHCHCFPGNNKTNTGIEANSVVEKPEVKQVTSNAFAILDAQGDFSIEMNDNFNFKTSKFSILDTISSNVTTGVLKLKDFLTTNALKVVDINGFYKSDEINNSAFPNLGLARANSVKNYLVSQGASSKQINTRGQLNDAMNPDDTNTLFGPLEFEILTTKEGYVDDILNSTCDEVRKNPLVLHFNTGQAQINLTDEQRQKIADISHCVDKLGVKVQIVGHTDNTGNADNNLNLGQDRADFAKAYLIINGILGGNVEANSKGQTEPIADNATEEGRIKNRRTVITIN